MRGIHHRELGLAGFALLEDKLWVEVIADGHHLNTEALQLVFRTKPPGRVLAVSDGTKGIGMKEGSETVLWGRTARIDQGTIRFGDGTLAGSTITLLDAFQRLASDFGAETAIRACSLNPRIALGLGEPTRYLMLNRKLDLVESWWLKAL
jgi:N-acetylglucosamine-6-phosphate deacetylase